MKREITTKFENFQINEGKGYTNMFDLIEKLGDLQNKIEKSKELLFSLTDMDVQIMNVDIYGAMWKVYISCKNKIEPSILDKFKSVGVRAELDSMYAISIYLV